MQEIILSAHIHSVYSDGTKTPPKIAEVAAQCGIDVILLSDHNVFPVGFDGYYTFKNRQVLLITGEEIHDQTRQPQKNHMLVFGIHRDFSRLAKDPQALIDAVRQEDGLSFIAHAYDPALPIVGESDLSWVDWSVRGFTGLELWNNLSELKIRAQKNWQIALFALFPRCMAQEPPTQIRAIWDSLLAEGQHAVALGGVDAHTLPQHLGPFRIDVFPYSYHFRTIRNHLLLESGLTGDLAQDERAIMRALRLGHSFISYDLIKPGKGFRFQLADGKQLAQMGDAVKFSQGQKLTAFIPGKADCRLIRDGKVIERSNTSGEFIYEIDQPGIYRLECYRRYLGKKRGWIFSNPIYVNP